MDKYGFIAFYEEKGYYPSGFVEGMAKCLVDFEKAIDEDLDFYADDPFEILNKYRFSEKEGDSDIEYSIFAYIAYLEKRQASQNYTKDRKD